MERIGIKVNNREGKGKEAVKKLRKEGLVPAVIYSEDTNIVVTVPFASLKILRSMNFSENIVIDMEITEGKKSKTFPVFIKDIQFHSLTEEVNHIDFLKVSLKDKIKVNVPVVLKGEAQGIKEGEGVLEQVLRELEIEGLPLDIPEKIEVDVSGLVIGKSLHVGDLTVSENLKIVSDPGATVVTVVAKKEEPEAEAVVGEEAGPQEPEVIKEKKEEPEELAKEDKGKKEKPKEEKQK